MVDVFEALGAAPTDQRAPNSDALAQLDPITVTPDEAGASQTDGPVDVFDALGAEPSWDPTFAQRGGEHIREGFHNSLAGTVAARVQSGTPVADRADTMGRALDIARAQGLDAAPGPQQVMAYLRSQQAADAPLDDNQVTQLSQFTGMPLDRLEAMRGERVDYAERAQKQYAKKRGQQRAEYAAMLPASEEDSTPERYTGYGAAIGGELLGQLGSPENWLPGGTAKTVVGRLGKAAAVNAGIGAAVDPAVQAEQIRTGEREAYSLSETLLAGVLSGAAGAALSGVPELARGFKRWLSAREQIPEADAEQVLSDMDPAQAKAYAEQYVADNQITPDADADTLAQQIDRALGVPEDTRTKKQREKEYRQRRKGLGEVFEAGGGDPTAPVTRRADVSGEGEIAPDAQPAQDATGTVLPTDQLSAVREIDNAARTAGVTLDDVTVRKAADALRTARARGENVDAASVARAFSPEGQKSAFDVANARRQRRESRLAGEQAGGNQPGGDYQAGGREFGPQPLETFTYLDPVVRDGQMVSGERIETTNEWNQYQGPDGRIVTEQKVRLVDREGQPTVWAAPDRLKEFRRPRDPRQAQDFSQRASTYPEGVNTGAPGERTATDRISSASLVPPRPARRVEGDVLPAQPVSNPPAPAGAPGARVVGSVAPDAARSAPPPDAAPSVLPARAQAGAPPQTAEPVAPQPARPVEPEPSANAQTGGQPEPAESVPPQNEVTAQAVYEQPVDELVLSDDVPQFKAGADESTGVVEALGGQFDRTGVAPIQVWERLDGTLEVISGRHRLDLARRSGETAIPAQRHREADGFGAKQAAALDAELNIRDEQGSVADYATYFKNTGITQTEAESRGLLARSKGRTGFAIAQDGSAELVAAHRAGQLTDEAARRLAEAAPGDARLQAVGMAEIQAGRSIADAANTMRAVSAIDAAPSQQGDIFGFDDSGLAAAREMGRIASAEQRAIRERVASVRGAAKRPEAARKLGVDVKDPAAVNREVERLAAEAARWDNWQTDPELVDRIRAKMQDNGTSRAPASDNAEPLSNVESQKLDSERQAEPLPNKDAQPTNNDPLDTGARDATATLDPADRPGNFDLSQPTRTEAEAEAEAQQAFDADQNDMFGGQTRAAQEGAARTRAARADNAPPADEGGGLFDTAESQSPASGQSVDELNARLRDGEISVAAYLEGRGLDVNELTDAQMNMELPDRGPTAFEKTIDDAIAYAKTQRGKLRDPGLTPHDIGGDGVGGAFINQERRNYLARRRKWDASIKALEQARREKENPFDPAGYKSVQPAIKRRFASRLTDSDRQIRTKQRQAEDRHRADEAIAWADEQIAGRSDTQTDTTTAASSATKTGTGGTLYSGIPLPDIGRAVRIALSKIYGGTPEQRAEHADSLRTTWRDLVDSTQRGRAKNRDTKRSFLSDMARNLFIDTDANLRITAKKFSSKTMNRLADLFHAQSGEGRGTGRTFHESVSTRMNTRFKELDGLMQRVRARKLDQKLIVKLVQNPNTPRRGEAGAIANAIEKLLREEHDYLRAAGVDVGDVGRSYFPRVFDSGQVANHPRKFVKAATQAYRADGRGADEAKTAAEALYEAIVYGDIHPPGVTTAARGNTPSFLKSRQFSDKAAKYLEDYRATDLDHVLGNYITRATKRAELAKLTIKTADGREIAFGDNFSNWEKIEKAIEAEDSDALGAMPQIRHLVAVSSGSYRPDVGTNTAAALSWLRTLTSLAMLGKSAFPSIGELVLGPLRGADGNIPREFADVVKNLGGVTLDSLRLIARMPRSERMAHAMNLAEDLGIVAGQGYQHIMAARFAGGDPTGRTQSKIINQFFRRTGLEKLTNYTRARTTVHAQVFLRRLAHDLDGSAGQKRRAAHLLRELGIARGEEAKFAAYVRELGDLPDAATLAQGGKHGQAYQTALVRFANQTVQNPNTSTRPAISAHPLGAVLTQLQSFNYAFQKNMLLRPYRMAKSDDLSGVDKALMASNLIYNIPLLMAMQYGVGEIKDALYSSDDKRELTGEAKFERAVSQSGLTGIFDPYIQMLSGTRYRRSAVETFLGPGLGSVVSLLDASLTAMVNDSENTNTAERNLTESLYKYLGVPLANTALTFAPAFGAGGAAASAATVWALPKGGGVIADLLHGPKTETGRNDKPIAGLAESLLGDEAPTPVYPGRGRRLSSRSSSRSSNRASTR